MAHRDEPTEVYTDGACLGNPGPGGWAWVVPEGRFASGAASETTNQRMEITAALEAVRSIEGRLEVVSDSTYVVNCFRDRWWEGWLARGWRTSRKQPVANRDLWEPLVEIVQDRGDVTFRWVKGHGSDPNNDLADRLAVEAATTQQGRSGDRPPAEVGAPDVGPAGGGGAGSGAGGSPGAATPKSMPDQAGRTTRSGFAGRGDAPPEGHLVGVFGHRPTELGGYGETETSGRVRGVLGEILTAKAQLDDDLVVVSGLRLGAEMLGAEAAVEADLPLVVVLPYPDPEQKWPRESQEHFRDLLRGAREVIVLQRKVPDTKQRAGAALARRDAWLARNLDEAVLVWDEQDASLGRLARSLEDHLGADVWILHP